MALLVRLQPHPPNNIVLGDIKDRGSFVTFADIKLQEFRSGSSVG